MTEWNGGAGPRIVAIGGGTGLSTMLRGLKSRTRSLTAIVTVADDGGGSGMLRQDLGMPPPGDIRHCMESLANVEPIMQRPQIIKSAPLMLGYAGVYSSFLLHTYRAAEKFHLNPRDILVELGRRGMVGGQEDMIIDVAHALSLAKTEC